MKRKADDAAGKTNNKKGVKGRPIELSSEEELLKLGKRIKNLRIKAGYTSYEYFAYEHDIPRAQFGRYGQGKDLRLSSLVKIVNAFGIRLTIYFWLIIV